MSSLFRRGKAASSSVLRLLTVFYIAMLFKSISERMLMQHLPLLGPIIVAKRQSFVFSSSVLPLFYMHSYASVFTSSTSVHALVSFRDFHRGSPFSPSKTKAWQTTFWLPRRTRMAGNYPPPTHCLWSTSSAKASVTSIIGKQTPSESKTIKDPPNECAKLLNHCLDTVLKSSSIAIETSTENPSQELMEAALSSLRDPSGGYDPKYGRPALRAYRSFVYPKKQEQGNSNDKLQLEAAAKRTANQIDFLVKRQNSRMNEAVRNHDDPDKETNNSDSGATQKFPITLVLDNLRGSFNVGSIFRTAEACGVSKILTCGITPHPFGGGAEKVAKSALGADLLVSTAHFATTFEALQDLKQNIRTGKETFETPPFVVALETTSASKLYTSVDYRPYYEMYITNTNDHDNDKEEIDIESKTNRRGIALILGNEVTGVDVELLAPLLQEDGSNDDNRNRDAEKEKLVDAIVELPVHGQKNSLNVAAVAPVILYEILRQWDSMDSNANE